MVFVFRYLANFVFCFGWILAVCLSFLAAEAQTDLLWVKRLGSEKHSEAASVIVRQKHEYLVGGFIEQIKTGWRQPNLYKITLRGDTLWTQSYPVKRLHGRFTHLLPGAEAAPAFWAVGYVRNMQGYYRLLAVKIESKTGRELSRAIVPCPWSREPKSVCELPDGDLLIAYNQNRRNAKGEVVSGGYLQAGLCRLSGSGQVLSDTTFAVEQSDERLVGLRPCPDGRLLMLTNATDYLAGKDYYRLRFFDDKGKETNRLELEWLRYDKAGVTDFAIDERGYIALGGNASAGKSSQQYLPCIWLLDSLARKVHTVKIQSNISKKCGLSALIFDLDGNPVVAGYTTYDDLSEADLWVAKIERQGGLLWEQRYGDEGRDQALSLVLGGRGEYLLVGSSEHSGCNAAHTTYMLQLKEKGRDLHGQTPRIFALIAGIDRYAPSQDLRNLRASVNDAKAVFEFLRSDAGGKLPDAQIRLLLNEQATKQAVLAAADSVFSSASPYDMVFFYFAGHGRSDALCMHDAPLSHTALNRLLKASPAMKRFCVIDACYSGNWAAIKSSAVPNERQPSAPEAEPYYEALRRSGDGLALLLSADANEESYESEGKGFFTRYYLQGLAGAADKNGDRLIGLQELYEYVRQNVSQTLAAHQRKQTPQLFGAFDKNMPVGWLPR